MSKELRHQNLSDTPGNVNFLIVKLSKMDDLFNCKLQNIQNLAIEMVRIGRKEVLRSMLEAFEVKSIIDLDPSSYDEFEYYVRIQLSNNDKTE